MRSPASEILLYGLIAMLSIVGDAFASVDCGCGIVRTDHENMDASRTGIKVTYTFKQYQTGRGQNGQPIYSPLKCTACDDVNSCEFTEYWTTFVNGKKHDSGTNDHKVTCPKTPPANTRGVLGINTVIPRELNQLGITEDFLRGIYE